MVLVIGILLSWWLVSKLRKKLGGGDDGVRKIRGVDVVRRVHCVMIECGCGVAYQSDMVAKIDGGARSAFDAGVGDEANKDDVTDPLLLQQEVEIGVGKAAGGPVLVDNRVAWLGRELLPELAAPAALGERLDLRSCALIWRRVIPARKIIRLGAVMRRLKDSCDVPLADLRQPTAPENTTAAEYTPSPGVRCLDLVSSRASSRPSAF